MVICKRCGGPLMSREHLATVLERLRKDAQHAAPELEPNPDPLLQLETQCNYVDGGIEQVVQELRGTCSACFLENYSDTAN